MDSQAPAGQIEQLARRLQLIEDTNAITQLFHAYAWSFDRADAAGIVALFTDDATVDYGPELAVIHGRDELAARVAHGLGTTFAATSHHISNVSVAVDGSDDARATASVYAWHRYRDGSPDGFLWGMYDNRFRRVDGVWRIAALVLAAAGATDFHRATMHPIRRPEE